MKTYNLNHNILSYLTRFAFLLFAILPVAYSIDWLFYTMVGSLISIFVIRVYYGIKSTRKDQSKISNYLINVQDDHIYNMMVTIVGLIVNYTTPNGHLIYFWLLMLIFSVIAIVYPVPQDQNKKVS